ncbi:MAG: hypothetical protein HYU36_07780 [Planctomycetes bacterium]|nr:hypothetical protein [Planctomycetota bacterium]
MPVPYRQRLAEDFERYRVEPLPQAIEAFLLERYGLDVGTRYADWPLKNPFGKASGQLSNKLYQVKADAETGLGFVILKTVIAQDAKGDQSMAAWAIMETLMQAEPIVGKTGMKGWTVSWKGRGWYESFQAYLDFFEASLKEARAHHLLVIPSCKYHLPMPGEEAWRTEEYAYTTDQLCRVWERAGPGGPMPIEKDFSPTLAGSDRARQKEKVLEWLRRVPKMIQSSVTPGRVKVGLKIMNAVFEDEFQLEMLKATIDESEDGVGPDWLIYANRLFDPAREFQGKKGIAVGGPDLSDRNLWALGELRRREAQGAFRRPVPPISGTGDIGTGRMAVQYALRGVENFQMHTLFQLPHTEYPRRAGSRNEKVMHRLFFDPETGLIAWLLHLGHALGIVGPDGITHFRDVVDWHRGPGREFFQE